MTNPVPWPNGGDSLRVGFSSIVKFALLAEICFSIFVGHKRRLVPNPRQMRGSRNVPQKKHCIVSCNWAEGGSGLVVVRWGVRASARHKAHDPTTGTEHPLRFGDRWANRSCEGPEERGTWQAELHWHPIWPLTSTHQPFKEN